MGLFKKDYGRLRNLSRKEWKRRLESGGGFLFKKIEHRHYKVRGPFIREDGTVEGDRGNMEGAFFFSHASKEQREFYEKLKKDNPSAALEYLLTITGYMDLWKEDIALIIIIEKLIEKDEHELEKEFSSLQGVEKSISKRNVPEILKKRIPKIFGDLQVNSIENIREEIKKIINAERQEENILKKYLRDMKDQYPFLFEDNQEHMHKAKGYLKASGF